jgi:glucans biosynthesis protein
VNPAQLRFNAYADTDPRGFGLLQRDRNFDHYQDDGVFYERRPSLWVEPRTGWGMGSVQLVEIPTDDETLDNIVAFWNPASPVQAGEEVLFGYRLHWGSKMPFGSALAHTVATRTGIGGVIGQRPKYFSRRFTVDFAVGTRALLPKDAQIEAVVSASSGEVERVVARVLPQQRAYRATFDVKPADTDEPVNLRMYLKAGAQPLTETWIYQWSPPPLKDRKY